MTSRCRCRQWVALSATVVLALTLVLVAPVQGALQKRGLPARLRVSPDLGVLNLAQRGLSTADVDMLVARMRNRGHPQKQSSGQEDESTAAGPPPEGVVRALSFRINELKGREAGVAVARAVGAAGASLAWLDVADNPALGDEGGAALLGALAHWCEAAKGMPEQSRAAATPAVRTLDMSRTGCGDATAAAGAAALRTCASLRTLSLSQCGVGTTASSAPAVDAAAASGDGEDVSGEKPSDIGVASSTASGGGGGGDGLSPHGGVLLARAAVDRWRAGLEVDLTLSSNPQLAEHVVQALTDEARRAPERNAAFQNDVDDDDQRPPSSLSVNVMGCSPLSTATRVEWEKAITSAPELVATWKLLADDEVVLDESPSQGDDTTEVKHAGAIVDELRALRGIVAELLEEVREAKRERASH